MLKVDIYAGPLKTSSMFARVAWLDIAYERLNFVADYKTVLFVNGVGALDQRVLRNYPRWSGSLWDLVMRCILISHNQDLLSRAEVFPNEELVDKQFAFAETLSATITHYPGGKEQLVRQLGHCEIRMEKRGIYSAAFEEHAGTARTSHSFRYNPKHLFPSLLLAHAICAALTGDAAKIPERPIFVPPPEITPPSEKAPYFDLPFIHEPLQTGLSSWLRANGIEKHPKSEKHQELYPLNLYWQFVSSHV